MRYIQPLFTLLFLCLAATGLRAQNYRLLLHPAGLPPADSLMWQKEVPPAPQSGTATELVNYLKTLVPALQAKGFLAASLDSVHVSETTYDAFLFLGKQYRWALLQTDSLPPQLLNGLNLRPPFFSNEPLRPAQLSRLSNQILDWYENNGYPFARLWLDDVKQEEGQRLTARLRVRPGALRHIDSIDLQGRLNIAPAFLQRYLDLFVGDVYNEKKLRQISPRLRELPFLRESKPFEVIFKTHDTRLTLFLEPKKANQLDALIGLAPNSQESGKFLLTVDARFAFQNILSRGESISFSYQNLQYKSPRLKAGVVYPYVGGTLFGLEGQFDLYKQDTAYRRTLFQAATRYQLSATDYLKVYYENQSNRLLTIDTAFVRSTRRLPANADVAANGGGAEILLDRSDYRLNPRKGYRLRLNGAGLKRHFFKSDAITGMADAPGFRFASLYDSLEANSYQLRLEGDAAWYLPLTKSLVLRPGYAGGWLQSKTLFQNELFLLGGFRLLRGFDEQSIHASQYHLLNAELRLLFEGNTYLYLFSDNAWVETHFNGYRSEGYYFGLGAGASLELKNGLFSLGIGAGQGGGQEFGLRQLKVHFGYISFF